MQLLTAQFSYWLLLIPLLSALIGWITIRIALQFVFRPYRPKRLLGVTIQGVIPRTQQDIAKAAGKFAADSFPRERIEQKITDPKSFESVQPLIEIHIDDFLRNKLKEQMPMIGMFIGDKTILTLKSIFIQEIADLFPQVMQQFANNIASEVEIAQLVTDHVNALSPEKIEKLLFSKMANHFHTACLFGAAIGFVVGLLQLAIAIFIR